MIYRPRCHAQLRVPEFGSTPDRARQAQGANYFSIDVVPIACDLEVNDHLTADNLRISFVWKTNQGLDPRLLRNAQIAFWLLNDPDGTFNHAEGTVPPRFLGTCIDVHRRMTEHGVVVDMVFRDYTDQFMRSKPVPNEGIPTYEDTITSAWRKLCDNTGFQGDDGKVVSSVAALRDRIRFVGFTEDFSLGKSVPARWKKFGKWQPKQMSSSWDVWQQIMLRLGLVSYIHLDECVVATSTEHFSVSNAPVMIWGHNIIEIDEKSDSTIIDKGVGLTALDTLTGNIIESVYPKPGDKRIHVKRAVAKRVAKLGEQDEVIADKYDWFEYHDITDQATLDAATRRAYEERSRQELQGTLRTSEMSLTNSDGSVIDLLELKAGDPIQIVIDPLDLNNLRTVGGTAEQITYLIERGYDVQAARAIAQNSDALNLLENIYHVKKMHVTLEDHDQSGRFQVEIAYHNRIKITGDSDDD